MYKVHLVSKSLENQNMSYQIVYLLKDALVSQLFLKKIFVMLYLQVFVEPVCVPNSGC